MNVSQISFCFCSVQGHLLLMTLVGQARDPLLSNHQRLLMAQKHFLDLKLTYGLLESRCRCLACNKFYFYGFWYAKNGLIVEGIKIINLLSSVFLLWFCIQETIIILIVSSFVFKFLVCVTGCEIISLINIFLIVIQVQHYYRKISL